MFDGLHSNRDELSSDKMSSSFNPSIIFSQGISLPYYGRSNANGEDLNRNFPNLNDMAYESEQKGGQNNHFIPLKSDLLKVSTHANEYAGISFVGRWGMGQDLTPSPFTKKLEVYIRRRSSSELAIYGFPYIFQSFVSN